MNTPRPKTFLLALSIFSSDAGKAKKFLADQRLSHSERTILRCYFNLRNNEWDEVITALEGSMAISGPFQESQRRLLLGLVYNNKSIFKTALDHLTEAAKLMVGLDIPYFEFVALQNLFIVHLNMRNKDQMGKVLDDLKKVRLKREIDKLRVLECEFHFYSFLGDLKKALKILEQIELLKEFMPERDRIAHLVLKFEFYIKQEEFNQCKELLEEMKNFRKFHLSQNYNFMKLLLDHYLNHGPIYFAEKDFEDCPLLYHQLKIIQSLEEGDRGKAQEHWSKLAETYPQLYGEKFEYAGGRGLFSLCLEKYRHLPSETETRAKEDASSKIINALYAILNEAKGPIRKELLFEQLWGRAPHDKEDLQRLTRSIYRLRLKYGVAVKSRKGAYYLEKTFSSKAS